VIYGACLSVLLQDLSDEQWLKQRSIPEGKIMRNTVKLLCITSSYSCLDKLWVLTYAQTVSFS
jgi:hypothetical protein